jgi:electron transport complex, RnfABCDGE type, B subunit
MLASIMFPVVIVTVIGTISGVILSVASIILAVPVDEKQENVREVLPGANCGACGYAGCDSYAEAVAKGEAKVTLCIPGGVGVENQLAEIMGVEAGPFRRMAAFVKCNGGNGNASVKMNYGGIQTCTAANQVFGGPNSCTYGCMGYGDCVRVCDYNAIHVINDVSVVDSDKCVGCSRCVTECPKGIISIIPADDASVIVCSSHDRGPIVRKACSVGCIACTKCVKVCPQNAISMDNFVAVIDYEKCNGCGDCVSSCPQKCISIL